MANIQFIRLLVPILLLLASCQNQPSQTEKPETANTADAPADARIRLTAAQVKNARIQIGEATPRPMKEFLRAAAELHLDKEHTATAGAFTNGILTDLRVTQNKLLHKDAVVAVLQKPDLVDIQQDYLENRDKLAFLQAEFSRFKQLNAADATALKNFQKAEADLRAAQTADKAMAARLRQFQIDPEQLDADHIKTDLIIKAPISGTVTRIHAGLGSAVQTGDAICEMADFSQLHPVIYVFEKDITRVKSGQKVLLHHPSTPGDNLSATIFIVERAVDPERKAVRVHARFDKQPAQTLVAGTYLDAQVIVSGAGNTPALPEEAVVREDTGNFIFALVEQNEQEQIFRKIPVRIGASDGGYVAIYPETPLPEKSKIVIKGAYYVSAQGAGIEIEE
ncbi:MAG: efflux RND transporter periplasmic adaptor subunit [Saprospiraceae bacterium]